MAKKREDWSMSEWRDYYAKLAQRAKTNYQESGEGRYDREYWKYNVIVTAFDGYLEHKDEVDNARIRRIHNIDAYMDNHAHKDTYTKQEVMALISVIRGM